MPARDELLARLGHVRRRWFAVAALTTIGRAAGASAIPLAAAVLAAAVLRPAGTALLVLAGGAVAAAVAVTVMVGLRMQRRPDDRQVARFVEERGEPGGTGGPLSDALVSAVQVAHEPGRHDGAFGGVIVARAVDLLRTIEPGQVIPREVVRRAAFTAIGGISLLAVTGVLAFPLLLRAGATAWVSLVPGSVRITATTGDVRVPAGRALRIDATVEGRGARLLRVTPALELSAGEQHRSIGMTPNGDRFEYTLPSVDRSFTYRVTAGSSSSREHSVTALFPPRVTRIAVRYDYPAFTRLPPRDDQDGGDIYAPAGTRVSLSIHADKPVSSGALALSGGATLALTAAGGTTLTAEMRLSKDASYRVRLTDQDGLHSSGDLEYFIRLMDDRPPDVRIVRPAADQGITPLEEVAIEARADDDYGVAALDLVYAVAGRPPRVVPFTRLGGTDVAKVGTRLLAAEDLGVQPGDVITYYARARDVARGKRSTETRSDIFFLEVKPFNEEFVAAQSQGAGAGAAGTPIDSLIAAQKEIIAATWNLERRAGAGRSDADTRAVGEAQSELKARVEALVRGSSRGARGLFPQQMLPVQPRRPGTPDPIAEAIEAMGRAAERLGQARTTDALPHEMAALQGLLQAQAEVRRREVMQQSASAAGQGGTSRTDRDLSALFDRELQRQQRTNYESPGETSPSREQQDDTDALDRVRALAKRQEELARRQRELGASQADAEEKKRQLEQLTREQEQLRREVEELEKRLRSGGPERGRGAKAQEGNRGDVQQALEEMKGAAGEMQQQNAAGAAERGDRAAQALRRLERQVRGNGADARQRAAGELQLEAQQVAEGQRRVAAETARLEKDGGAGVPDALRRLSGEKEKLAERVDELQRRASELERETPGAPGARFRDAAQQLRSGRIGDRMRATAKEMRQEAAARQAAGGTPGAKPASRAPAEQQLSRALNEVVDSLGARAGGTPARRRRSSIGFARCAIGSTGSSSR
jgi:hypothetical protein